MYCLHGHIDFMGLVTHTNARTHALRGFSLSPGCPGTQSVNQAGLKLIEICLPLPCIPSAGINGMHQHRPVHFSIFNDPSSIIIFFPLFFYFETESYYLDPAGLLFFMYPRLALNLQSP